LNEKGYYILKINYSSLEELEKEVYDILNELDRMADMNNCFTEPDAKCEKLGLSW